jgi:hypothetical protein
VYPIGHLTNTRRSDGAPESDGVLRTVVRTDIKAIGSGRSMYSWHLRRLSSFIMSACSP